MLKFSLKFVIKTSLFPNLITDLIHLWYDDTCWSKILRSTIPTTLGYVKVKVTDLEFSCKILCQRFLGSHSKLNDGLSSYLVS